MQSHTLKRSHANKKANRVGRAGARGKTSGRGTKGQKARAGHRMRPEMRDLIKKLPKLRGRGANSNTSVQIKPSVVNVSDIAVFTEVNPKVLLEAGLVRRVGGKVPKVKILGNGEISAKVVVSSCIVSTVAKEKIEKAGGSITA